MLMVIVGRTKIPYNDLYILSRSELDAIIEGHEIDKKDDWERTRMSTYITVSPNFKKGSNPKPENIFPLPWDVVTGIETMNIPDLKEGIIKAKEVFKRYGKVRN